MRLSLIFTILTLNSGCATQSLFLKELREHPESIWKSDINPKINQAIADYSQHTPVGPPEKHLFYGDSVRQLDLKNKSATMIEKELAPFHCTKNMDVIKEPKTHTPLKDARGQTIPMLVFLCPDGGAVRLKPQGDATSRFRPQPHGSKCLRYPYNAPFKTFDDEVAKVDNQGFIIPKRIQDLKVFSTDDARQEAWITDWANDAHTDLPTPQSAL